jgi:hypothetical protein
MPTPVPHLTEETDFHAEKRESSREAEDSPQQRAARDQIRAEAMEKIRSAVAGSKILTEKDVSSFQNSLRDSELEQFGHRTHEEKLNWLRKSSSQMFPNVIAQAREMESRFFSAVSSLEGDGLDRGSADRWRDFMRKGDKLWFSKQSFLKNKFFADLYPRWKSLLRQERTLQNKISSVKGADKIAEVAKFKGSSYTGASLATRESILHSAFAALAAQEKGRSPLYGEARARLLAVSTGANRVLSPTKVNLWLRRIFESNADEQLIRDFIDGDGHGQLGWLINQWTEARAGFDGVEKKRQNGKISPTFHFVTLDTFLDWHYDARMAYVKEADNRDVENASEAATPGILLDIRREMDMRDWRSAQALIDKAKTLQLSEENRRQVASMQQYLNTQRVETPKTTQDEEHDESPQQDMHKALAELKQIDGGLYDMYVRAMARGPGALSALGALMYNRCWTRQNSVLDDSDEEQLRQRSKDETQEIVDHGHTKKFENNQIDGFGTDAIRDHDKGEWSPQVLHIGNDPAAHEALAAKCEAQQNNRSFKYWSTLIPEGVGYSQHQYVVFNLQWRLKSGLRSAGSISEQELLLTKNTTPATQKPSSEALATAA